MTITPFLSLKIRGKKDAVLARLRARRVAGLLSFDPHEQACIAAGTFVVVCQALMVFGKAKLCFQVENHQLHIFAQDARVDTAEPAGCPVKRLSGLFPENDAKSLFRLVKPLPAEGHATAALDIGWMVRKVEETACSGLFDEIVKQNQEILALLHEVRLFQGNSEAKEQKMPSPHAA